VNAAEDAGPEIFFVASAADWAKAVAGSRSEKHMTPIRQFILMGPPRESPRTELAFYPTACFDELVNHSEQMPERVFALLANSCV
jgi:hypothetical protein